MGTVAFGVRRSGSALNAERRTLNALRRYAATPIRPLVSFRWREHSSDFFLDPLTEDLWFKDDAVATPA